MFTNVVHLVDFIQNGISPQNKINLNGDFAANVSSQGEALERQKFSLCSEIPHERTSRNDIY